MWIKLLLAAATSLAMLPVMEAAVRVVAPQPASWLAIYRHHPVLPTYCYQPNATATVDTGESHWTVRTDEWGFRVPRQVTPVDNRPIVLWLGDSFTFGYGVEYEDSFVGRLALDPQRHYRHINAGVGGHGPTQYRQMLEYLLGRGLRPRMVLVATFLGNDFLDCINDKDIPIRDGILGNEGGVKSVLKQRFHLYRLVSKAMHQIRPSGVRQYGSDINPARSEAWAHGPLHEADLAFRKEFQGLAALCKEHGIEMRGLIIPLASTVDAVAKGTAETPDHLVDQTLPLRHAVSVFEDLGIRYLDLMPSLVQHPISETYFYYDGHLTPRGNAVVAAAVRSEWGQILLQPSSPVLRPWRGPGEQPLGDFGEPGKPGLPAR